MVDLNDLKASSEQNWEPAGTPKVAQGASRLNPKLSGGGVKWASTEG